MWKFHRTSNGGEYVPIRVTHRLTRSEVATILANWTARTEVFEDMADIMQRAWVERSVRDALDAEGEAILLDDIDDDRWLDWAEAQIERYWSANPKPKVKRLSS